MKDKTKKPIGPAPHKVDCKKLGDDILVIGGGGREHAIVRALHKSPRVGNIYAAPGNAGMDVIQVDCAATDIDGIISFVQNNPQIKMTVVAPDDPLAMGLVDELQSRGLRAFGPIKAAAKLEWSKAYAKDFMKRYGIPTAAYEAFDDAEKAKAYVRSCGHRVVVKADGLALGKGVIICNDEKEAEKAIDEIMSDKKFGTAGDRIVVEEFLTGYEVSLLCFCDGEHFSLMPTSCDHKRALDGDKGLNTGGMGAYSPCPAFTEELIEKTKKTIVEPTVNGMIKEGAPFKGVLYFGLMVDGDDIRVLEYNARFGDPETQSVLPLLNSDLYEIFGACIDGTLDKLDIKWSNKKSINVVLASGGYPLTYKKGCVINGLESVKDADVYFAGVKKDGENLVTSGGRVLCVHALADTFKRARAIAYDNIKKITFENCYYRSDIGKKLDSE